MRNLLPAAAVEKAIEIRFQDEARVGQKGTLTSVWARCGTRPRAVQDTRYGWSYLFGAHAVLMLDGAGWHVSRSLVIPVNISLLKLPPYSPEHNPIETVWAYLRGTKRAHCLFSTYDDIVNTCCEAWNSFLADTKTIRSVTTREWATCQTL